MIRVGPAGWAYKDWSGIVYPAKRPRGFSEAKFLSGYFDTIELNVTFYRVPVAKHSEKWLRDVRDNEAFQFTAKLWRGFTHERNSSEEDERAFKQGLLPLHEAHKLGALLLQFPWSFRNTAENRDYVLRLADRFRDYPLVLEVRHGSWSEPGLLDLLHAAGLGLCNIDQPLHPESLEPSAIATSPTGYVRLHGRNYNSWFTESKYPGERYDYLYSPEELDPWIDRIQEVSKGARDTYVVTNNHYLGKGIVNAIEISAILKGAPLLAPETLVERFPELGKFASIKQPEKQLSLYEI